MADVITRLKLESGEYDSKIKRATQGLLQMEQECRKVGGTLAILEKDQKDFVQSIGRMETVSKTARGRIGELSSAYTELAMQYKRLTDEEKKGDYGKALNASLAQLKGRLDVAKKDLADVEKEMKGASAAGIDFNAVLQGLGSRFGINSDLMGALTSGTLATTAAVTAGAAAVAAATKMWADYNDELNRQTNVTTVTTGLKGDDAENLTIGVRALAKTYDVDFREAINAANTLIQQFGVNGEQALTLLQDGMQGMIAGDGGKLLSMIQQYAPSFRDAGISASQLVAVIQNTEGGIFTDQNMNAIVMGIRNIRLMTKQTSDALAQLGIDGQDMSRKLEDGSMTIFDALRQVSDAIDNVDSGSKAAGEVMQSVFGRQGTMAGTKLGEAVATLNTNLEETKTQTGELGQSFVRLNEANIRLENTMKEVFGMTGWEDMSNLIKTDLANTLSDVLEIVGGIRDTIKEIGTLDGFETLAKTVDKATDGLLQANGQLKAIQNTIAFIKGLTGGSSGGGLSEGNGQIGGGVAGLVSSGKPKGFTVTTDNNGKVINATRDGKDVLVEYLATIAKNAPKLTAPTSTTRIPSVSKKEMWAPIAMQAIAGLDVSSLGRSKKDVKSDMAAAQKENEEAGDVFGRMAALKMIEALKEEQRRMDMAENPMAQVNADFNESMEQYEKESRKEEKSDDEKTTVKMNEALLEIGGGLSGIMGGLEQLGVDLPAGMEKMVSGIQTVSSILSGIATVVMAIQAISAADTIIPFAHGGVVRAAGGWTVPGRSYNDTIPSLLSSGEVVLNRAQQGNLLSQMESGGGRMSDAQPYVDGEKIWLGVNNYLKRSGRGEIVVSKK